MRKVRAEVRNTKDGDSLFFKNINEYIEKGVEAVKDASGYSRAVEIAKEELAKRGRGNHNNEGDAMRHAEWNRRMTEELGASRAWAFGTAHEIDGLIYHNQPWNEAMMDMHNNAVGRAAGSENRPVDKSKLRKGLNSDIQINPYD